MNLSEAIDWATDRLESKQIEDARLEAEILLVHALAIQKSALILYQSQTLDDKHFKRYQEFMSRRLKHEPTAYITGVQPFMSLDFIVDRRVLIPRPETEELVVKVINTINNWTLDIGHWTLADIGTGSGAIAVSLAKNLPAARVIGIDASAEALKLAKQNAEKHRVADRCQFIKGSLLEPLKERVNVIVSNPPYIPSGKISKLQPEVKDWEPRQALDGGKDGLDYIRKIISESPSHLTTQPPGYLFLEFGFGQAESVAKMAENKFREVKIIKDYSGLDRIFSGRL